MTFKEYLAVFPQTPTEILKKLFPQMKSYDLSNFISNNLHASDYKNRCPVNGLSVNNKQKTDENITRKLKSFCENEFGVTEENFISGLTSETVKEIVKCNMKENYGSEKKIIMVKRQIP